MSDAPKVFSLVTKPKREYDTSKVVAFLEAFTERVRKQEITGVAMTWASAPSGDVATWWGTADGSGHINDLASGIARLQFRYQNEAYNENIADELPE